jgi:uncharacterized protein
MDSYRVDVRPILEDLGGTIVVSGEVAVPVLELGSERFVPVGPALLDAAVTNTGAGLVATGTVTVSVTAECSRCLREFVTSVTGQIEGFWIVPGSEDELPEEQEYAFIQGDSVDLAPPILAALALEVPFAPVHAEDCAGICPTCGADLNDGPCGCAPEQSDSPFAVLRDLVQPHADE